MIWNRWGERAPLPEYICPHIISVVSELHLESLQIRYGRSACLGDAGVRDLSFGAIFSQMTLPMNYDISDMVTRCIFQRNSAGSHHTYNVLADLGLQPIRSHQRRALLDKRVITQGSFR